MVEGEKEEEEEAEREEEEERLRGAGGRGGELVEHNPWIITPEQCRRINKHK